jgi:hypothetical protein
MRFEHGTGLTNDLPVGAEIFTSDGDKIGEVKEVQGSYFKVNAAMQPDYWLPISSVASTTGGRVMLSFHKDHLGDYKTAEPRVA